MSSDGDNDTGSRPQDAMLGRPQDALTGRSTAKPAAKSAAKTGSGKTASGKTGPDKTDDAAPTNRKKAPKPAKPAPKSSDPKRSDPKSSDPKSSDPKSSDPKNADSDGDQPALSGRPVTSTAAAGHDDDETDPGDRPLAWFIGSTVVLGFVLRMVALGDRALHHDESLDAWWSYRYLNGTYDGYDPIYHGPLRFYITALFYWLFGESPATSRLFSALAGTALIGLAWYLRKHIGRVAAGATAAMLCLSPSLLYYSRFGREDAQIVFLTALMLVVTIAYFHRPRAWQPSAILLALSASLAIKESTYLLIFTVGSYVLIVLAVQFRRLASGSNADDDPDAIEGFAWQLPVVALVGMVIAVILAAKTSAFLMFGLYGAVLVAIAVVFALQARNAGADLTEASLVGRAAELGGRPWAIALGLFLFSFVAFFTVWFTRPGDWHTGVTEAISYWDSQQEVNRGGQPWYYYFVVIPAYEWVAIFLAVIGSVVAFRKQTFALGLVAWLAVSSLIVYSYAGERMPWLVVHPVLPIIILAGVGTQVLWRSRDQAAPKAALALLGLGFAFTVFTGVRLAFPNGTDGRELMVQGAQATDHVPLVQTYIEELENIGRIELGREPTIAIGHELSWPWGWYFRDIGYAPFPDSGELPDSDIILRAASQPITDEIAAEYSTTLFALRGWWVPAWVQKEVTGVNEATGVEETTTESTVGGYFGGGISGWIDWQLTREAWPESEGGGIGCGSADQYLLVRKDLAAAAEEAVRMGLIEGLEIEPLPCVSAGLRSTP